MSKTVRIYPRELPSYKEFNEFLELWRSLPHKDRVPLLSHLNLLRKRWAEEVRVEIEKRVHILPV